MLFYVAHSGQKMDIILIIFAIKNICLCIDENIWMLAHTNSINQNIQFTSEKEQGHVILLDITILHNNDGSLYQSVTVTPPTRISSLPTTPLPGCCFHLTQESCFSLFDEQSGMRGEVICEGDPPAEWLPKALPLSSVLTF